MSGSKSQSGADRDWLGGKGKLTETGLQSSCSPCLSGQESHSQSCGQDTRRESDGIDMVSLAREKGRPSSKKGLTLPRQALVGRTRVGVREIQTVSLSLCVVRGGADDDCGMFGIAPSRGDAQTRAESGRRKARGRTRAREESQQAERAARRGQRRAACCDVWGRGPRRGERRRGGRGRE